MTLSPFSILGTAWKFYRKHGILNRAFLWLLLPPITLDLVVIDLTRPDAMLYQAFIAPLDVTPTSLFLLSILAHVVLTLWLFWGTASVLLIGKRIAKSAAGRSRSSFSTVRQQAAKLTVPLFLTDILRDCFTIFWMILLIVPGLIYRVRTVLYPVVTICEGLEYRAALHRSQEIVRGHSWATLWAVLGVSIPLVLAPTLIYTGMQSALSYALMFAPIFYLVCGALSGFMLMLFLLSLIVLYRDLLSAKSS